MRKLISFLIVAIFAVVIGGVDVKAETPYQNKWNVYLTPVEIELLSRTVQLEAGNEIKESKYATVETILNRIISNKYPNTLVEVLSQNGQFGTWKHITTSKATPTFDTYQCVATVLVGQTNVLSYDNLHFNNRPIGDNPIKIGNQYYGK